jgi:PIN domain nuclease of toxin-antitoxin system
VILLDTHTLIWLVREPRRLSQKAGQAIRNADGGLAISAMTLWEVAYLAASGRLNVHGPVDVFAQKMTSRVVIRPITLQIALLAAQLPDNYPKDPADKLIGATAMSEDLTLVTKDRAIRSCKLIRTVW